MDYGHKMGEVFMIIVGVGKDEEKDNFWGTRQKLEVSGAGWVYKQAGASQCRQERDTATSPMTNTNSELASELPVVFLLEGNWGSNFGVDGRYTKLLCCYFASVVNSSTSKSFVASDTQ